MADYVVDASVVIEYLFNGAYTSNARALLGGITVADRLMVPEFCLLECTNVIWKRVRFSGLSLTDASNLMIVLRAVKLRRAPMKHLLDKSLEIAVRNQLAVYDSGYVALAGYYTCPLVSIDQPQIRAANAEGIAVKLLTDFLP